MKALVALEDGKIFEGNCFTDPGEAYGELVFNTSMTGYQEILTDPSYHGQVVMLTYPLIGNYGTNPEDDESYKAHARALLVGDASRIMSNHLAKKSLPDYLNQHKIPGVDQLDCRAITQHIRSFGAMRCVVSAIDKDPKSLMEKVKKSPSIVGKDIASEVFTKESYVFEGSEKGSPHVATIDCGIKVNQLRIMRDLGCKISVFPGSTSAEKVMAMKPDGLFVSNGPGDPAGVLHIARELKKMASSGLPTFGICFGHQLLSLAFGAKTYKLKFGHRGANHPVMDLDTKKIAITSQNHGFAVDLKSLPNDIEATQVNLNDQTNEG
nr:glutamine-hydrolyzing carbamoyl-phosphate synthase small subunit [Victivallales bacterium]